MESISHFYVSYNAIFDVIKILVIFSGRSNLTPVCRLHDKVRLAETMDGASFYTLFDTAIQLGVISRRRVYHEAIQYEKDRNAGFLSPFGYSTPTVTAAVDAICSMEVFYFNLFPSLFPVEYRFPLL
jgi:hypothetical protein